MVLTKPGERDKKSRFSFLNLAAYFAIAMFPAVLETA